MIPPPTLLLLSWLCKCTNDHFSFSYFRWWLRQWDCHPVKFRSGIERLTCCSFCDCHPGCCCLPYGITTFPAFPFVDPDCQIMSFFYAKIFLFPDSLSILVKLWLITYWVFTICMSHDLYLCLKNQLYCYYWIAFSILFFCKVPWFYHIQLF